MKTCHIAFAGGSCGISMLKAADRLAELCERAKLPVETHLVYLWVSDYLQPQIDLVVEMFPYYQGLRIPLIDGKALISGQGADKLYERLLSLIREISAR